VHEYGIMRELVARLGKDARELGGQRVMEVRLRRGSVYSEAALRRAFAALVPGTPLAGAQLVIEGFVEVRACEGCGRARRVTAADVVDHVCVCPDCGAAGHVDEAYGLEVLAVTAEETPAGGAARPASPDVAPSTS
jgi:Zn finger protein HypA/HybF involved in hydrogenase expression